MAASDPDHIIAPHTPEHLGKELAASVKLSFNERQAAAFMKKTRETFVRTRKVYRSLARNIDARTQYNQGLEVLLDNFYIVDAAITQLASRWKEKESLRVPQIVDADGKTQLRVYMIARALVKQTNGAVGREAILSFLKAYQRTAPLSIRELDIFPDMLRFALTESIARFIETNLATLQEMKEADRWYDQIVKAGRRKNAFVHLKKITSRLAAQYSIIPQSFGLHLLHRLSQTGKEGGIRIVSKWLKLSISKHGVSHAQLASMNSRTEREQMAIIASAISSLRYLGQVRWDRVSLELNMIDAVLAKDPAGAFLPLTEETRSFYRRTIVRIADRTGTHDIEVAREAVRLARHAADTVAGNSPRTGHVGYYLIDTGIADLEAALSYEPTPLERLRAFILRHGTRVYFSFIGIAMLFSLGALLEASDTLRLSPAPFIAMLIAGLLLSSEVATALAHFIFTRVLKPRPLPALDLRRGVGEERRTIVVVPSMFRGGGFAEKITRRLETNFIGNNDPNIFYALLMDFRDADSADMPDDEDRVRELEEEIAALNKRYPSVPQRFSLFYRSRKWNAAEGCFMGWERKRGKLREFNALLRGKTTTYSGDAAARARAYGNVPYILTLDEDTELVRDSGKMLIGTIDHPLNRPVIDPVRAVVTEGYGIVQPRSALRFRDGNASVFSRLFGNFPGVDTYSLLISDLHQDLFGEGIFHGKGVYNIDAIEATMGDRIPENTVLSHDLLEGLYARVGIASDARIFEGFPANYREYMQRSHRWIRGDWQIISWLFGSRGSVFSPIGRYRIFDNLRRSVLPIAAVGGIIGAAWTAAYVSTWSILIFLALGSGQLISSFLTITERTINWQSSMSAFARFESMVSGFVIALIKTAFLGIFLLNYAVIAFDAIVRSMYRLFVSKRRLLEWQTAYEALAQRKNSLLGFVRFMWRSLFFTAAFFFIEVHVSALSDPAALAWVAAWLAAPFFAVLISAEPRQKDPLSKRERLYLRKIAARTHWFFTDLVTEQDHWLVPDHLQEDPPSKQHSHGPGMSPTNLGMYLLGMSCGRELGFLSLEEYRDRIERAFTSLEKLELYRGHFFNWYELKELTPLAPKYVSSVDSANLALSLLSVHAALKSSTAAPVIDTETFEGFRAQLMVLRDGCDTALAGPLDRNERPLIEEIKAASGESLSLIGRAFTEEITPRGSDFIWSGVVHRSIQIRNALETLRLEGKSERFEEIFLAVRHMEVIAVAHRDTLAHYVGYAMVPVVSSVVSNSRLHSLYLKLAAFLQKVPTIDALTDGRVRREIEALGMDEAIALSELPPPEKEHARAWYAEVLERLALAEHNARETAYSLHTSAEKAAAYAYRMDFRFLYNKERGLFHIGYNHTTGRLDEAFYDLFASEANSASIVSIAKNDVSEKHWGYLGRTVVKSSAGEAVVASWAGSLFEYLGTLIYFDVPAESFWGTSARHAIAAHQWFARRYRIPWGMGESASSRQDAEQNYHYQAFGEPSLGYKRDLSESIVVAPYTSALALSFVPRAALMNFKHLERAGGFGRYGFYDAIDFTFAEHPANREGGGRPARVYYAHHQGFILSSITNVLRDNWVRKMIARDPSMDVASQLFEEKMPENIPLERISVVVPRVTKTAEAPPVVEARRQYLPWHTKETASIFISSDKYRSRITSAGAGESCFDDVYITRPSRDMLRESTGTFFYLYDKAKNRIWSPTFMPTKDPGEKLSVSAGEQLMVFDRHADPVTSSLVATPLPRENGELRELTVLNTGDSDRTLTFGVCAELSLSRISDGAANENYERLFVSTETQWDGQAIIASRPDPHDRSRTIVAGFLLASDAKISDLRTIREKEVFYGSPRRIAAPPVLADLSRADHAFPVHTLDSVAAFAGSVRLRPHESRRITLVSAAGYSKEQVLATLRRYRDQKSIRRVIENADQEGSRFLSDLGIVSQQGSVYGTLASLAIARMLHNRDLSPAGKPTRPWVSPLWKMGISGVRPIILLSVGGVTDLPMVRQLLGCHAYFAKKGIPVDIVIFNTHAGGYLKTFEDEIEFLLNAQTPPDPATATSKVYHARAEQLREDERTALLSAAAIRIDAKKGFLTDVVAQLQREHNKAIPPQRFEPQRVSSGSVYEPIMRTDVSALQSFNGIGGYDPKTREYVIEHTRKVRPPRPWSNIISNDRIGFIATDRGMSFTWARNSHDNKLTVAYNDPLSESSAEAFYVRDDASGASASLTPLFGPSNAEYEVRFGEQTCAYRTRALGIDMELTMYLDPAEAVKYYRIAFTNTGGVEKRLSVFGYFELLLGSMPNETKKLFSLTAHAGKSIAAVQNYRHTFLESRAVAGIVGGADVISGSREEFLGRFGDGSAPAALAKATLSDAIDTGDEAAASFQKKLVIPAGGSAVTTFFLGETTEPNIDHFIRSVADVFAADRALRDVRTVPVALALPAFDLPDKTLTTLMNRFLPHQTVMSRIHARLGFSQIGGAFGFRDQLQDALAALWYDPQWAREHILACAAHQFREGDVLSWWMPYNNFGARTLLSDPQLWLPYVALSYVSFTGDQAILDEVVPYLVGEIPDWEERPSVTNVFEISSEKSSLYEHLIRAVEHSLTAGSHGLPLMGTADWNDSMNRVGSEGAGESVWLAWLTVAVLDTMSKVTDERKDPDRAARYRSHAEQYRAALEQAGWDGRWYRRAFTDTGALVGSNGSRAFRLDSIAQSWAYFTNGASDKTKEALRSAKEVLGIYEGQVPLGWPPLSRTTLDLGTISDYPPGVRENASQYDHAALWLAQALFAVGDPDAGKLILDAVNPFLRSETREKALVYQGEPYAVAAEIYSSPTYPGRAGWTWYTASAGAFYRTVIEYLLGMMRSGQALSFSPSFPSDWRSAHVMLPFGSARYSIEYSVEGGSVSSVEVHCDKVLCSDGVVTLVDDAQEHTVQVKITHASQGKK
ncbi:hypothetical protein KGO95_00195 [Patescibacteria group bacterium]|nr:hypothetical protein [Patescibacteria group bacterium]